jgi:hypothetical protein
MHDPQTVAHEIKYPWWKHKPWPKKYQHSEDRRFEFRKMSGRLTPKQMKRLDGFWDEGYRETFITIWHVDPEKDGTDDSCGYSFPKLSREQKERLRNVAWHEAHNPHFLCCESKQWTGTISDAEILYRGMVTLVVRSLRLKYTWDEICQFTSENLHIRDIGKAGDVFCFLPGYHSNLLRGQTEHSEKESQRWRQEHFTGILCGIARSLLDRKRPWWKHPRWHFWHWKIQCHPLQDFKRWMFSRCTKCGGRFKWGEAPVSNSWHGTGPLWFRREKDVECGRCHPVCAAEPKQCL